MKLGLWGARGDSRGLAYQTLSLAKWLQPDKVMCIDMTADDLSPYPCDFEPFTAFSSNLTETRYSNISDASMRQWLKGLDVVIGAETFYRDEFVEIARSLGVRTILQVNPEFVPYFTKPGASIPRPDVLINPSPWRMKALPEAIHLPFPVDREDFPFRLRTQANHFVHIAGHKAVGDRAGTRIVLGSVRRMTISDWTIRAQSTLEFDSPIKVEYDISRRQDLYSDADVVVLPRRYGGQSLVANEALSSGCPLIVLDREPDNSWGGVVALSSRTRGHLRTSAGLIPMYEAANGALASEVAILKKDPSKVEALSQAANIYADTISWDTLLPRYQDLIRGS